MSGLPLKPGAVDGDTGGAAPTRARLPATALRLNRLIRSHWQFAIVTLAALLIRIVVVLGYPPVLWFTDSYNYVQDAITRVPDEVRPNGYPFLLGVLEPLHSLYPVALLQAAMGIAIGVASYALLRHRGLPWWGAALPALPVLFDSYELHLEHMVTADPLFIFLVTIAVVMLCWNDRPSVAVTAVAGLMIGYATIVRSVGEPLLVVVLAGLLARRAGWRRLAALAVAGVVPIAGYMIWFHHYYGKYALTESLGPFLYSRVSTFAECSVMNVPADLRFLCDPNPPRDRPPAGEYIWDDNDLPAGTYTPIYNWFNKQHINGANTALRFTAEMNARTKSFAERAISAQPGAYVRVVTKDIVHTFGWNRQPDPDDWYGNGPAFGFVTSTAQLGSLIPWYARPQYATSGLQARQIHQAEADFSGPGLGATATAGPWDRVLTVYQSYIFLRGSLLGVIVLIGFAGVALRWRRLGGLALLPWLMGALLIVLPPATAGFSYRYVLAAVPLACLAAGLTFATEPGETPVRALAVRAGAAIRSGWRGRRRGRTPAR